MNIPFEDVLAFAAFCCAKNITSIKTDLEEELLYQNFKLTQQFKISGTIPEFKDWADTAVVVTTKDAVIAKAAKKVPSGSLITGRTLKDGPYDLYGRITHILAGGQDYKVVLKGLDLKEVGRAYAPAKSCKKYPKIESHLRKLQKTSKESFQKMECHIDKATGSVIRGYEDTFQPIGKAIVSFKDNSIYKITKVELNAIPVATAAAPVPTPAVVIPITAAKPKSVAPAGLKAGSISIDKNDPILIDDPMLSLYRYNPNNSRVLNIKEVLGRIGEVAFNHHFKNWKWNNTNTNNADAYDFENQAAQYTLDVKTTNHIDNNLLIEKKKVERNNMADIFALCIVLDGGNHFDVRFVGFINKKSALAYIGAFPACLMGETYKIHRQYLVSEI